MPIDTLKNFVPEARLRIWLQPIISVKEKRVIGFEALIRGTDPKTGLMISPVALFKAAREAGRALEFDRLCRKTAVREFLNAELSPAYLLFINFNPSILAEVATGSGWMRSLMREEGLDPANVAIEIVESPEVAEENLIQFVELYKGSGFLIVLDDFGASHSNLDRILTLKPDILKIDRGLINGIGRDYYKQSIIGSISNLAGKIGTLVLAEGVEAEEDIVKCFELGVNLFQGYYFARPAPADQLRHQFRTRSIAHVSRGILRHLNDHITRETDSQRTCNAITRKICAELTGLPPKDVHIFLMKAMERYDPIQCIYVIDAEGRQISHTHCKSTLILESGHPLYKPSSKGTDHSLQSYFYYLDILKLETYFSDPYTSLATGCICRTMSAVYREVGGASRILCVDFKV